MPTSPPDCRNYWFGRRGRSRAHALCGLGTGRGRTRTGLSGLTLSPDNRSSRPAITSAITGPTSLMPMAAIRRLQRLRVPVLRQRSRRDPGAAEAVPLDQLAVQHALSPVLGARMRAWRRRAAPAPFSRRLHTLDGNLARPLLFTLSCVFVPPAPLLAALDAIPNSERLRRDELVLSFACFRCFRLCTYAFSATLVQADAGSGSCRMVRPA